MSWTPPPFDPDPRHVEPEPINESDPRGVIGWIALGFVALGLALIVLFVVGTRDADAAKTSGIAAIKGNATWYEYVEGQAAAGRALRDAIGPDWRGTLVEVCGVGCRTVRLTDYMSSTRPRLVDLDSRDFVDVCGPLGVGICKVVVAWGDLAAPTAPPTDVEPTTFTEHSNPILAFLALTGVITAGFASLALRRRR